MDNNFNLDFDLLSKELCLLLEILKIDDENSIKKLSIELPKDIDWEKFLSLTRHHRVYPLIYSKLIKINEKIVPSYVIQTLYKDYKKNTFQMLHLSGEMEQVSKVFTENQIRLLFLKGPVMAADLYGDISLRTSKDLDILIQITDLKRADEILVILGYEKEEEIPFAKWKWMNHHVTYFHPQKGIEIEVHWRIHPYPTKVPNFNELWERKRISEITSYPVYYLGVDDLFLFLVEHGARHAWFRLRWLVDIDQILRKRITNNNNILQKNQQNNYSGGQAIILASQLLNTPINQEMHPLTTEKRSRKQAQMAYFFIIQLGNLNELQPKDNLAKYQKHHKLLTNMKNYFSLNRYRFSQKSNVHKFIFIIKLFFPSSMDVKTLKLPKLLHFLYFPLRPFLWSWRKTRNKVIK